MFLVQRLYRCVQSTSFRRRPTWLWRKSTYSCCWLCLNDVGNYGPRLPGVGGDMPKQVQSGVGGELPHPKQNLEWEIIYSSKMGQWVRVIHDPIATVRLDDRRMGQWVRVIHDPIEEIWLYLSQIATSSVTTLKDNYHGRYDTGITWYFWEGEWS